MRNKLITFEGIDGSGKSTQIRMLENELKKNKIKYTILREPGGTSLSEKIRDLLLKKDSIDINSLSEGLLFAAARSQLTSEKIVPALNCGKFVICDRFSDSTIAYQGYGRGLNIKRLENINNIATDGLSPKITFILDIDPKIAVSRINMNLSDRMESESIDFFIRIRKGYQQIKKIYSNRCVEINANESPAKIFFQIKQILKKKFPKEFPCF